MNKAWIISPCPDCEISSASDSGTSALVTNTQGRARKPHAAVWRAVNKEKKQQFIQARDGWEGEGLHAVINVVAGSHYGLLMLLCMQQVLKPEQQNSQFVNVTMVVFKHRHLLFRVGKRACFGLKYLKLSPQTQLEMSWLPVEIIMNMSGCAVRPTNDMKFCRPSSKISSGFTLTNAETQSRTVVTGLVPLSTTIPSTSWCESPVVNMWCE